MERERHPAPRLFMDEATWWWSYWLSSWWSSHVPWARPITMALISVVLILSTCHFAHQWLRGGWRLYAGVRAVRIASSGSVWQVGPAALLMYRSAVFVTCFLTLVQSVFNGGVETLRWFTVWNFTALVIFFALGTGLSCPCCREIGLVRSTPSRSHRVAAALHHLLLEVELPMSAMITAVV